MTGSDTGSTMDIRRHRHRIVSPSALRQEAPDDGGMQPHAPSAIRVAAEVAGRSRPASRCSRSSPRSSPTGCPARATSTSPSRRRRACASRRRAGDYRRGRRACHRGALPRRDRTALDRRRRGQGERPRPSCRRGEGAERRHHGGGDGYLAARAGMRVFVDRRARRRAPRCRADLRRNRRLPTLAGLPLVVVSAGVKSILDIRLTLERLETLNLAVVGYRTTDYPGFYVADRATRSSTRSDSPAEIAAIARARDDLGIASTLLVANPSQPTVSSTRAARRACSPRRCPRRGERRLRPRHDAVPARLPPARDRRSQPRRQRRGVPRQRRSRCAHRRGPRGSTALMLVGDRRPRRRPDRAGRRRRSSAAPTTPPRCASPEAGVPRTWPLLAAPRHPSRFIGRVGDDRSGTRSSASSRPRASTSRCSAAGRTGSIVVLVDAEGERTMITDRGAAAELARRPRVARRRRLGASARLRTRTRADVRRARPPRRGRRGREVPASRWTPPRPGSSRGSASRRPSTSSRRSAPTCCSRTRTRRRCSGSSSAAPRGTAASHGRRQARTAADGRARVPASSWRASMWRR